MFPAPIALRPNFFIRRNALLSVPSRTGPPYLAYILHSTGFSLTLGPSISLALGCYIIWLTYSLIMVPPLHHTASSSSHLKRKLPSPSCLPPHKRLLLTAKEGCSKKRKGHVIFLLFHHFIRPPKILKLSISLLSSSSLLQGSQATFPEQPLRLL